MEKIFDSMYFQQRWKRVHFFPTRAERYLARYWVLALLLAFSPVLLFTLVDKTSFRNRLVLAWYIYNNGFVLSLFAACLISGFVLVRWEKNFRKTFGNAIKDGLIRQDDCSLKQFFLLSNQFEMFMSSRRRYLYWAVFLLFIVGVNRYPIAQVLNYAQFRLTITGLSGSFDDYDQRYLFANNISIIAVQIVLSYIGTAVGWCLVGSAIWVSRVGKSSCLQLQLGHSDNCCGLGDIGMCLLRSALPLLIGMLLLMLWINGHRFVVFEGRVNADFLDFVKVYAYALLIVLVILAASLVFLPVLSLHKKMQDERRKCDVEYSRLLKEQSELSHVALMANYGSTIKCLADRLKIVQSFDPVTLKIATWPFDRAVLITYGITPAVSLLAPLVKKFAQPLMQAISSHK